MSHTAHVREEALHLENVCQLFQVLRVIQYQEFIRFLPHDFASIATVKLDEENTQVYEQKLGKNCTINGGLLPKIGLIS